MQTKAKGLDDFHVCREFRIFYMSGRAPRTMGLGYLMKNIADFF